MTWSCFATSSNSAVRSSALQRPVAIGGALLITLFLAVHVWKDLTTDVGAWYFHSTPVWLLVLALAGVVYLREVSALRRSGVDLDALFGTLPPE